VEYRKFSAGSRTGKKSVNFAKYLKTISVDIKLRMLTWAIAEFTRKMRSGYLGGRKKFKELLALILPTKRILFKNYN
jgi:hypothetical protein